MDIISIGTLSRNLLWNESTAVRTPHATCSLIRAGKRNILVDPGLPGIAIAARLYERVGMKPEQIDTVFLTSSKPAHRNGLDVFTKARKYIHETERIFAIQQLKQVIEEADDTADRARLERELGLLDDLRPADDKLAPGVDLFPLFGYTPGTCGLLIASPTQTILIATDAVPTQDHLLAGQVLPGCVDLAAAKESLGEVYEIADIIIPGHDNWFTNPRNYGQ